MKKRILAIALTGLLLVLGLALIGCGTLGRGAGVQTFTGEAQGFNGLIRVEIDVQRSRVVDVRVVENHESPSFFELPFERTISSVVNSQSLNVDRVAGATFTS